MPLIIVCPQCSTKLSAPDYAAGKLAKCPKVGCGFLIPVPATVESTVAFPLAALNNDTPAKPAAKKIVKAETQEDPPLIKKTKKRDIDEDDEELPRGKRRRDYEEDEEDEFPRKKRHQSEDDKDDLPRSKRRRDDDKKRSRPKRRQKNAPSGLGRGAIIGIVLGGITLLFAIVFGIVLLTKDSGTDNRSHSDSDESSSKPIDASRVTRANFNSLKAGMTLPEIEDVLGGSRSSSENDFREALRKNNLRDLENIMGSYSGLLSEIKSWRRWDGAELIAFVAFVQASDGKRAAYSASLVPFAHGYYMYVHGFSVDVRDVEKAAQERNQEVSIRDDKKWVGGAQARELLLGQWRDKNGKGYTFGAAGKIADHSMLGGFGLEPTYQLDDRILTISRQLPNLPPSTERYEYHVNQEELALVNVSPGARSGPRFFYRMPVQAGSAGETKLLGPLLADLKSTDEGKQQQAYMVLYEIGKGAAIALPQLAELFRGESLKVALHAASLIGNMKGEAVSVVPALIEQLRNSAVERALASAQALSQIGPPAKEALPALYDAVKKSKNAAVRNAAQDAIRVIEGRKF
jgi:hypothetical protein